MAAEAEGGAMVGAAGVEGDAVSARAEDVNDIAAAARKRGGGGGQVLRWRLG